MYHSPIQGQTTLAVYMYIFKCNVHVVSHLKIFELPNPLTAWQTTPDIQIENLSPARIVWKYLSGKIILLVGITVHCMFTVNIIYNVYILLQYYL